MWDVHQNALDVPSPKTMVPLLYSELGETVWRRNIRWLRRQKSLINSLSTHWGIGQYTKQYQTYWGQSLLVYFPSSGPLGKPWWSPIGNQGNHPLVLGQKSQCIRDIFSTFFSINSCFRSLVFFFFFKLCRGCELKMRHLANYKGVSIDISGCLVEVSKDGGLSSTRSAEDIPPLDLAEHYPYPKWGLWLYFCKGCILWGNISSTFKFILQLRSLQKKKNPIGYRKLKQKSCNIFTSFSTM